MAPCSFANVCGTRTARTIATGPWWRTAVGAALGITLYWPVVALAAAVDARDAAGWDVDETAYWILLPVIAIWALWGLVAIARGAGSEAIRKSTD